MGRDEATERLRMMHGNLQGRPGHTQRAERRALAVAIEHLAADNNHKALVEALLEAERRLRVTHDGADWDFAEMISALVARQEGKAS